VNIALLPFSSWSSSEKPQFQNTASLIFGFIRKAGPLNHLSLVRNRCAGIPRDASSAGLRFPGQCLHWQGWEVSLISATLLATYVLNLSHCWCTAALSLNRSKILKQTSPGQSRLGSDNAFLRQLWQRVIQVLAQTRTVKGRYDSWPWYRSNQLYRLQFLLSSTRQFHIQPLTHHWSDAVGT